LKVLNFAKCDVKKHYDLNIIFLLISGYLGEGFSVMGFLHGLKYLRTKKNNERN
jgi:hypothetical protein